MALWRHIYLSLMCLFCSLFGIETDGETEKDDQANKSKSNRSSLYKKDATKNKRIDATADGQQTDRHSMMTDSTSHLTHSCSEGSNSISNSNRARLSALATVAEEAELTSLLEEFDLYVAAKTGDTSIMLELLRLNAIGAVSNVNQLFPFKAAHWSTTSSATAVCIAASLGHFEIVDLLLLHPDLDPNMADVEFGWSALHLACEEREVEVVQALLRCDKLDVNTRTKSGEAALFIAAEWGFHVITGLLLADSRTDVNTSRMGWTSLHCAVDKGYCGIVEQLLAHPDIDANRPNDLGDTALHLATYGGDLAVVKLLLKHPLLQINSLNAEGDTPFDCVCKGYFVPRHSQPLIEVALIARGGMPHSVVRMMNAGGSGKTAKRSAKMKGASGTPVKVK